MASDHKALMDIDKDGINVGFTLVHNDACAKPKLDSMRDGSGSGEDMTITPVIQPHRANYPTGDNQVTEGMLVVQSLTTGKTAYAICCMVRSTFGQWLYLELAGTLDKVGEMKALCQAMVQSLQFEARSERPSSQQMAGSYRHMESSSSGRSGGYRRDFTMELNPTGRFDYDRQSVVSVYVYDTCGFDMGNAGGTEHARGSGTWFSEGTRDEGHVVLVHDDGGIECMSYERIGNGKVSFDGTSYWKTS
jgi:hypothetical protein